MLAQNPAPAPLSPDARRGEDVTIKAREQEKTGAVYKLRGEVEIDYRDLVLHADEATYDSSSGDVTASGHLTLDGGTHDVHVTASHGTYNIRSQVGRLYDVSGTSGVRFFGNKNVLSSSSPFSFSGTMVERNGPDVFVVHHGKVTSCKMPNPKWTLNAERIVVDLGAKAKAYNTTFRVEKVPLFYLPFADHPAEQLGRQTGFLIPSLGTSSRKGFILGESFYWAINPSMDASVGAEYFSKRGWANHGSWRFRPSEDSYLNARYFGVLDTGFGPSHIDQGGEDVRLEGEARFPRGFRGVLSAEYLSSFVFRLAWGETFTEAVQSEVKSSAFLSKNLNGFGFNFLADRYQNFQVTTITGEANETAVTILHVPSFELSSVERPIGRAPLHWSFDGAVEGVSRKSPGLPPPSRFATDDLVGRFDVHPLASVPLMVHGWTLRPEVGVRETYYTQSLQPNGGLGTLLDHYVNRNAVEASLELRPPSLARIFDRPVAGHKLKHVIEPRLIYRAVGGVNNFANIIRFDSRDILSDTNEVEYAIVQRLYSKPEGGACEESDIAEKHCPSARELVSWEVKQKYFFDPYFGGAVFSTMPPRRFVLTTTDEFTGIAFISGPRVFSPVVSRILVHPSEQTDVGWQLDYDPVKARVNASTTFADYRLGSFFLGGAHSYFQEAGEIVGSGQVLTPATKFNQFRARIGYGNLNKRGINAAATIGFDANLRFLQYAAFQSSYNWDCCGLSFEYRRYALGAVRNENQYRFAFTLANIATFGNLKRQERIY